MKNYRGSLFFRSFAMFATLAALTPLGGQQYHGQLPPKTASESSASGKVYQQDEVGAVMVSLSAFPWEEVADQMNANITRTTDQAIGDVQGISATTTQSDVASTSLQLMLSYLASGAGNATTGNSTASGVTANTTGSLPNLGTLPALPTNLSVDPRLTYVQATGLIQWLAALSRRVQLVNKEHYMAYLVNLNLDFVPYRTDAQVNVFTTVAFFAYGSNDEPLHRQPIVIPVLSTDDMEQIRQNAAAQQLTNYQLNMGGAFHAINAAINAATGGNATQSFAGDQLNSLTTSGPFMQNAYFVRFGARQQANGPALVPQSTLIPVVLLIPDDTADPEDHDNVGRDMGDRGVRWVSYTVMRDAKTGVALSQATRVQHTSLVDGDLYKFYDPRTLKQRISSFFDLKVWFKDLFFKPANAVTNPDNAVLDDIRDIKVPEFLQALKEREVANWQGTKLTDYEQPSVMERVWTMLAAAINQPGHFNSGNLVLLNAPTMTLPPSMQAVTLADDGKAMTATMVGGNHLAASRLQAKLALNGKLPDATPLTNTYLWAQNITISPDGHNALMTFPSLANFGPGKADSSGKTPSLSLDITTSQLTLYDMKNDPTLTEVDSNGKKPIEGVGFIHGNPVVYLPSKALDAPAKPLFRLGAPVILVDNTGKGTLTFWITKDAVVATDPKAPNYDPKAPNCLSITGADITLLGAAMTPANIVSGPDAKTGLMPINGPGQVSFTILNASPANDITISALDNTGAAKPNPVTLRVQFQTNLSGNKSGN